MKVFIVFILLIISIVSCTKNNLEEKNLSLSLFSTCFDYSYYFIKKRVKPKLYDYYIYKSSKNYGIDPLLVKAIIQVESNYNPNVISKSNAVGLMQIKPEAAGRDAYRLKGRKGQPSLRELKNVAINIDIGTTYLFILQKNLNGIVNPITRRYAMIVSYVNGLNALLKIFSIEPKYAILKINNLQPEEFCQYIEYNHPSKQAQCYLKKVNTIYLLLASSSY